MKNMEKLSMIITYLGRYSFRFLFLISTRTKHVAPKCAQCIKFSKIPKEREKCFLRFTPPLFVFIEISFRLRKMQMANVEMSWRQQPFSNLWTKISKLITFWNEVMFL
jgi:hypothetical protein